MIDRFERFSYAISEISRHWHKLTADEMERHGLKGTHSVYLLTLLRFPNGVTAPQLCELCGRDKADVSRMMSIMEDKGFVRKESNGQSLYRGNYKLTEAGTKAAEQVYQRAASAVQYAGRDLDVEKRTIFYDGLESIAANLRFLSKNGIPDDID